MGVVVILLSSSSSSRQHSNAARLASRFLALGLLAAPLLRTCLRVHAATPTPSPSPQGSTRGGDRTDYAATVLRRSPACRVERKEERASARWSSLHERRSRSRPSYTSERTILTSDAEKPHRSYNDLAGFPDRTLRSHSSQPAARPQSNSFAINRPPMPPRRNSGTT